MTFKIRVRSRRKKQRPTEADRRDDAAAPQNISEQVKPVNDNDDKVWPLIPFPDDWYGS